MEVFYIDDSGDDVFFLSYQARKQSRFDPVVTFVDGEDALEVLRNRIATGQPLPGIIVVDLYLPGLDGSDLLRAISALDTDEKIFFAVCSGSSFSEDEARCRDAGAAAFFEKPLDLAQLAKAYEQWT